MQSMQEEYAREKTSGLSSRAIDAMTGLARVGIIGNSPVAGTAPAQAALGTDDGVGLTGGAFDDGDDSGDDDGYAMFDSPTPNDKNTSLHTPSTNNSKVSGSAASEVKAGITTLSLVQQTSARESELERQLLKAKKEKERALKVIITIIGRERLQEHLMLHSGQKDILTTLVDACQPGGSLAHFRSKENLASVSTIRK